MPTPLTIANTQQAIRPYRSYTAPKHQIEIENIEDLQHNPNLNCWESDFIENIAKVESLTGKQRAKLTKLANKYLERHQN